MKKYRSKAIAEARGLIDPTPKPISSPTKNKASPTTKPTKAKPSSKKPPTANASLHRAKKAANDEFYTQLADIENELRHYKAHFQGKTVYCNCDDPYESNFFQYFARNFHHLGLKKLITTGYAKSPIAGTQLSLFDDEMPIYRKAHKIEITDIENLADTPSEHKLSLDTLVRRHKGVKITNLKDDGDFRNKESLKCLAECDIVVTNPPFSLFREYVAQLMEYHKKFLIIGNQNAITYKEIFPLIKNNQLWLGNHSVKKFLVPNPIKRNNITQAENGKYYASFGNVCWFTNLEHHKRHEFLTLYKNYNPDDYPKYDNYNAIEVSKVADIPIDYDGAMGVPITFLDKYNPEQFEIIKFRKGDDDRDLSVNGKCPYFRILIKHKR